MAKCKTAIREKGRVMKCLPKDSGYYSKRFQSEKVSLPYFCLSKITTINKNTCEQILTEMRYPYLLLYLL